MEFKANQPAASSVQVAPGGGWPLLQVADAIAKAHLGDQVAETEIIECLTLGAARVRQWLAARDPGILALSAAEQAAFERASRWAMLAELAPLLPVAMQRKSDPAEPDTVEQRASWYWAMAHQAARQIAGYQAPGFLPFVAGF